MPAIEPTAAPGGISEPRLTRVAHRKWSLVSLVATSCLGLASLSGCGTQRSVASYCHYFYGEGSTLRNQWIKADEQTNTNPLGTLIAVLGAPSQLADFFHNLSQRAPTEIADDVQTISNAFKKLSDSESGDAVDPLGGLASGLVTSLSSAGAYERVDTWTERNCGPPPSSASN